MLVCGVPSIGGVWLVVWRLGSRLCVVGIWSCLVSWILVLRVIGMGVLHCFKWADHSGIRVGQGIEKRVWKGKSGHKGITDCFLSL